MEIFRPPGVFGWKPLVSAIGFSFMDRSLSSIEVSPTARFHVIETAAKGRKGFVIKHGLPVVLPRGVAEAVAPVYSISRDRNGQDKLRHKCLQTFRVMMVLCAIRETSIAKFHRSTICHAVLRS